MNIETEDTETLLRLEQRRCTAVSSANPTDLENTLYGDYVHVHADGSIDDRTGFVTSILSNPRTVERGPIAVRIYGYVAILIGEQTNRRDGNVMVGIMHQVALKHDGEWRFVSAQMTRKG